MIAFWAAEGALAAFSISMFAALGVSQWRRSEMRRRRAMRRAAFEGFFCRDCRWAYPDPHAKDPQQAWRMARCLHPSARLSPENFLVSGEDRAEDQNYCSNERKHIAQRCGPYGRYWAKIDTALPNQPPHRAISVT